MAAFKSRPFTKKHGWKEISFQFDQKDWEQFERQTQLKTNISCFQMKKKYKKKRKLTKVVVIKQAYISKYNSKREDQVISQSAFYMFKVNNRTLE